MPKNALGLFIFKEKQLGKKYQKSIGKDKISLIFYFIIEIQYINRYSILILDF